MLQNTEQTINVENLKFIIEIKKKKKLAKTSIHTFSCIQYGWLPCIIISVQNLKV